MPETSSITIQDATPSDRVYTPIGREGNTLRLSDKATATTLSGRSSLVLKLRAATPNMPEKAQVDFVLPIEVTDSDTGLVTAPDAYRFHGQWIVPSNSVATDRAHFNALVMNALADSLVGAYLNGEPAY